MESFLSRLDFEGGDSGVVCSAVMSDGPWCGEASSGSPGILAVFKRLIKGNDGWGRSAIVRIIHFRCP